MDNEFRDRLIAAITQTTLDRYAEGMAKIDNLDLGIDIADEYTQVTSKAVTALVLAVSKELETLKEFEENFIK